MPRILVVDDSRSMLVYLESILRKELHEVFVASSGTAALNILKTQALELVITDIYMPPPDGLEVMQFARAMHLNVPFIAISGYPPPLNMFVPARGLGTRIALRKPFSPEQLMEAVEAILDSRLGTILSECQTAHNRLCEEPEDRVCGCPPPHVGVHSQGEGL